MLHDFEKYVLSCCCSSATLTRLFHQEKKRRKRAEKLLNNGGDLSAEAYKNQLLIVKAELEKKTQEVASLNSRIDTREQRAHYESNFGRDSVGSPLSNDSRVGALEQKIRELLQKMEEKDQLLQYQAQEIRKVTQLQAQLQVWIAAKTSSLHRGTSWDASKKNARAKSGVKSSQVKSSPGLLQDLAPIHPGIFRGFLRFHKRQLPKMHKSNLTIFQI